MTVTATIKFVTPGVVNKTPISISRLLPEANSPDATVFMDSYGMTWAAAGRCPAGPAGQRRAPSPSTTTASQLINFLTANMELNPGLEPLRVFCSMHATADESCRRLMMPDAKKKKRTVYIAMNVLVDKNGELERRAGGQSVLG